MGAKELELLTKAHSVLFLHDLLSALKSQVSISLNAESGNPPIAASQKIALLSHCLPWETRSLALLGHWRYSCVGTEPTSGKFHRPRCVLSLAARTCPDGTNTLQAVTAHRQNASGERSRTVSGGAS